MSTRCKSQTAAGKRCKRKCKNGEYCFQHCENQTSCKEVSIATKECSICLTDYPSKNAFKLWGSCNHEFCKDCILTSLCHKNACPLCRAETSPAIYNMAFDYACNKDIGMMCTVYTFTFIKAEGVVFFFFKKTLLK